ncbi:hypothetical protein F5B20DRAFT_584976 [Whalleya microplaca]|nr:hypothetical protein F5B20DRAFT_584976 [Whalleya microplaca]
MDSSPFFHQKRSAAYAGDQAQDEDTESHSRTVTKSPSSQSIQNGEIVEAQDNSESTYVSAESHNNSTKNDTDVSSKPSSISEDPTIQNGSMNTEESTNDSISTNGNSSISNVTNEESEPPITADIATGNVSINNVTNEGPELIIPKISISEHNSVKDDLNSGLQPINESLKPSTPIESPDPDQTVRSIPSRSTSTDSDNRRQPEPESTRKANEVERCTTFDPKLPLKPLTGKPPQQKPMVIREPDAPQALGNEYNSTILEAQRQRRKKARRAFVQGAAPNTHNASQITVTHALCVSTGTTAGSARNLLEASPAERQGSLNYDSLSDLDDSKLETGSNASDPKGKTKSAATQTRHEVLRGNTEHSRQRGNASYDYEVQGGKDQQSKGKRR